MSNAYTLDNHKPLLGRSFTALVGMVLAACSAHAPPAATVPLVVALPVHADAGAHALHYPIEAAARYQNALSFRVAGKIVERTVRLGDRVHTGQILARLDAADAERQAAAAHAALDAAEHRLIYAQQQLDRDRAQAAAALIAASALEQTEDAWNAARAARDQAADQATIADHTLHYHVLVADHDGAVTAEAADTGQYVAAGQAVFGIAWSGAIDAILDAAAGDLKHIAVEQTATVAFAALPGTTFRARVREIAPTADPQSRTYRVKLTLASPADEVRPGMTGSALLDTASTVAATAAAASSALFTVPATAVFHRGDAPAVWVVGADSTLQLRPVSVQGYQADSATIDGGLRDGDTVVQAGVHTVFAGERVQPIKPLYADDAAATVSLR